MSKLFEIEVEEGNTSCDYCPFIHNRHACLWLSESKLCSQYNFHTAKIKESNSVIKRFTTPVTNKEMVNLLSQYPSDSIVAVECCNPRTMRYNPDDNTIRID
jgi:hypothetical protein